MTYGRQPENNGYPSQQSPAQNLNYQGQQPYAFSNEGGNPTSFETALPASAEQVASFERAEHRSITRAYGEMSIGLLVTAAVAYLSYATNLLYLFLVTTKMTGWIGLLIAQVLFAVILSAKVMTMKPTTGRILFYVYAAVLGFSLSSLFVVYSISTLLITLLTCAGFFFALTMLGLTTRINMLKWTSILFGSLIALIVVQVALMFIAPSDTALKLITTAGIVLFAILTMHDAQQTRLMFAAYRDQGEEMIQRVSILCALNLYLDFVNLFIYILRLVGSRD